MSRLKKFMTVFRRSVASPNFGELYPILHDRTGATTSEQLTYAVLHECLTSIRPLESKWGHDKIYGVLEIFSKICGGNGHTCDELFQPNYDLSAQKIFTQVAWLLLRELPSLCVLSSVEDASARRLKGLPSWVPDWTSAITVVSLLSPSANASIVSDGYQGYRKPADSLLTLNGGFFDAVADIAESP